MGWRFWTKKQSKTEAEQPAMQALALFGLENRLSLLEREMQAQTGMLDERTRVMADAMSTELRALGHIMADLARTMAELNAKLDAQTSSRTAAAPPEAVPLPERVRDKAAIDELAVLVPPPPANDPPAPLPRHVDPMLLDALAKGRVAFDVTRIASIPPRAQLLALMRFAPPLPEIDLETVDRLASLFPDAALLLDRLMIDAAASMVRHGQINPDLPLLVPLSPVTVGDSAHAADFRRRFERHVHRGGVFPLLSEKGWVSLVEAGDNRMAELAGTRGGFAIRVSGERRIDHAAIGMLGARYVLAPAGVLAASGQHPLAPDIHGADVARLFARAGVGLIAENVPDQVSVLGLLRNGIGMGWGPALQFDPTSDQAPSEAAGDPGQRDYRAYLRKAGS